jgi:hypothetical protein
MIRVGMTTLSPAEIGRRAAASPASAPPSPVAAGTGPDEMPDNAPARETPHASLPLIALVMGIGGVALGVTVIWFFAAIPVGLFAVAIGLLARRNLDQDDDPRAASRATIGTALGCVAVLLGITGAYFLPRVIHRADRFLGTVQQDVNQNIGAVNHGLTRDVNRLDFTLSRDLRRFEHQNRSDLTALEQRTSAALAALETRLNTSVDKASGDANRDLVELEKRLTDDLHALQKSMHDQDDALHATVGGLDARITSIERWIAKH